MYVIWVGVGSEEVQWESAVSMYMSSDGSLGGRGEVAQSGRLEILAQDELRGWFMTIDRYRLNHITYAFTGSPFEKWPRGRR